MRDFSFCLFFFGFFSFDVFPLVVFLCHHESHRRKNYEEDTAITKQVQKSTASARALTRLAQHRGESNSVPSVVEPFYKYLMNPKPPSKQEGSSKQCLLTHRAAVGFEKETWEVINTRWLAWHKALMEDPLCTPTQQQMEVIQNVHLRTKYEYFVENNLPLSTDIEHMTLRPMCHMIHGLPGAGKSKVLMWLQSYWETVWRYERGIHFAFVAYSNSMADNINGFTIHSFFALPWKNNDGQVVNTSNKDDLTTFLTKMSLLKFVIIDEVEAAGLGMINQIHSKLVQSSTRPVEFRKVNADRKELTRMFGGVNFLMCGDL